MSILTTMILVAQKEVGTIKDDGLVWALTRVLDWTGILRKDVGVVWTLVRDFWVDWALSWIGHTEAWLTQVIATHHLQLC